MKRRLLFKFFALGSFLLLPSLTRAAQYQVPLSQLLLRPGAVRLTGYEHSLRMLLPVSPRATVQQARLTLEYMTSVSLVKRISQLQVRMDGTVLAQVPLNPEAPAGQIQVKLPSTMLTPGVHRLTIVAIQQTSTDCAESAGPQLWTQIDTDQSHIALDVTKRTWPHPTLANLSQLYTPGFWWTRFPLTVTLADSPSPTLIRAAQEAVAGVALRLGDIPLVVNVRSGQKAPDPGTQSTRNQDSILIGTTAAIQSFLPEATAAKITSPFIAVLPDARNPGHVVLVLSGKTPEQVLTAATAFAENRHFWPDQASAFVTSGQPHPLPLYGPVNALYPGKTYRFDALGLPSTTLAGADPQPALLRFWMPPDLFVSREKALLLTMDVAYGAGMGGGSVLNVFANGRFVTALALNQKAQGYYQGYVVKVPVSALRPGSNVIAFQPRLNTATRDQACATGPTGNLLVTIGGGSALQLPVGSHYAILPSLRLLGAAGFPFISNASGQGLYLWYTQKTADSLGAGLTLFGRLAQVVSSPLPLAHAGFEPPARSGNLVVVGPLSSIPTTVFARAPFQPSTRHILGLPSTAVANTYTDADADPGVPPLLHHLLPNTGVASQPFGRVHYGSSYDITPGFGGKALLMSFQTPARTGTALVFTAPDGSSLWSAASTLVQPSTWNYLYGNVAWWDANGSFHSTFLGTTYTYGRRDSVSYWTFVFSQYPQWWVTTVAAAVLVFALVLGIFIARIRRRWRAEELGGE